MREPIGCRGVASLGAVMAVVIASASRVEADAGAVFYDLGPGSYSAMSSNGAYVVFSKTGGDVFGWSAATGQVGPILNVGTFGFASAVSDDGSVLAGSHRNASGVDTAFRWTAAGGFVDLGDLPGGSTYSDAFAMSADGSVVVGGSASGASGTRYEAFRWTAAGGMQPLGDLAGGLFTSNALSVSGDGSVVVGTGNQSAGYEAFRWTQSAGMVGLGDLPGGPFNSQAYKVSSDGGTVIGYSSDALGREQAFRWTQAGGLAPLGFASANPNEWSQAHAVSGDGLLIGGNNNTGATLADVKALIWDPVHGMRYFQDAILNDYGVSLPGWRLNGVWDISADGRTIAGSGTDPLGRRTAWVVTVVPEPAGAAAVVVMAGGVWGRKRRGRRRLRGMW